MRGCSLRCHRSLKGPDLAHIGRQEQQSCEKTLRRYPVNSAPARVIQGLVGGILDVSIEPFIGVAQGGTRGVPLGTVVEEVLVELGARIGRNGHALLTTRQWRVDGFPVPASSLLNRPLSTGGVDTRCEVLGLRCPDETATLLDPLDADLVAVRDRNRSDHSGVPKR